jgi:hypothetical protein
VKVWLHQFTDIHVGKRYSVWENFVLTVFLTLGTGERYIICITTNQMSISLLYVNCLEEDGIA